MTVSIVYTHLYLLVYHLKRAVEEIICLLGTNCVCFGERRVGHRTEHWVLAD